MKKKYLAAILGIMMATASVTACGAATTETTTNTAESSDNKGTEDTTAESAESTDDSDSSADADKEDSDEEDVTYGEVKSVEDGKITIAVGTMKDMGGNGGAPEKPDENGSGDASADTSPMQRAQNLTAKMQSPIKRTAKMGIQQITEKLRRNRTVTMQMEMVEPLAEIRERHLPCWI